MSEDQENLPFNEDSAASWMDLAKKQILENGNIMPMMFLDLPGKPVILALPDLNDAAYKDQIALMLRKAVNDGMRSFFFLTEAWTVTSPSEDDMEKYKGQSLEHVPGRKEILMASLGTP